MRPLVQDHIASLKAYEPGKPAQEVERELGLTGVVKLASNENPLGPSPRAMEAVREAASDLHYYPDGGYYLKRALAERFPFEPSEILLGNGSNELIELLIRTFVPPGMHVAGSAGAFIIYKLVTIGCGREFVESPLGADRGYDLEALAARVSRDTRMIFIANPNNPTGSFLSGDAIEGFVEAVDAKCGDDPPILVLDEAYHEYVDREDRLDSFALVRRRPRTVVMRTFSKAYGMAGIRCGYAFASEELCGYVNRIRAPFNVNNLALVAGAAALDDDDFLRRSLAVNREGKVLLTRELKARGFEVSPSQTNFLFVDVHRDGREVFEQLQRRGVIVRPMGAYGLPTCLRITIGTPEQNEKLLGAFDDLELAA
ncbi:MAG: histidinol-phosphate transaminase [Myxococcota bacterium]